MYNMFFCMNEVKIMILLPYNVTPLETVKYSKGRNTSFRSENLADCGFIYSLNTSIS